MSQGVLPLSKLAEVVVGCLSCSIRQVAHAGAHIKIYDKWTRERRHLSPGLGPGHDVNSAPAVTESGQI